jgi:prolyl 4-hydroxylase
MAKSCSIVSYKGTSFLIIFISCLATIDAINFGFFDRNNENEEQNHPDPNESSYGADVSFPMHHEGVSINYPWLPHNQDPENNRTPRQYKHMAIQPLGDRAKFYESLLQGCRDFYDSGKKGRSCDSTEKDRIAMSLRQPKSMQNYTDTGFKKIKAPDAVFKLLKEFWKANGNTRTEEQWFRGNTYTNHWESKTQMVSVENSRLRGGGGALKKAIWDAAHDTLSEWTGEELTECSLYGIRVYSDGAVLASHVDRMPLVSSAIVNVAQDVDEPWPLEVIGHDGKAHNVTMEPGDMVLYESHSVIHGRPFPLKGRFYANVFIHFEPTGHSLRHGLNHEKEDLYEKYHKAVQEKYGGHENEGIPPYILENSEESEIWHRRHPGNRRSGTKMNSFQTGSQQTEAHLAAQDGDVKALTEIVDRFGDLVNAKDEHGWAPIHEGVRTGKVEVVDLLLRKGADINDTTHNGESVLYLALNYLGAESEIVKYLEDLGAELIGPEL